MTLRLWLALFVVGASLLSVRALDAQAPAKDDLEASPSDIKPKADPPPPTPAPVPATPAPAPAATPAPAPISAAPAAAVCDACVTACQPACVPCAQPVCSQPTCCSTVKHHCRRGRRCR